MIYQQVTLSGDAEWPKVADAVIEAKFRVSQPFWMQKQARSDSYLFGAACGTVFERLVLRFRISVLVLGLDLLLKWEAC